MFSFFKRKKELPAPELTVVFGSQTGNAKQVAKKTAEMLKKNGVDCELKSMAQYRFEQLETERNLLIIISTTGEGEPPAMAGRLYRKLLQSKRRFEQLNYAVCALGDSSYENFCMPGKIMDQKLSELGAKQLMNRCECDEDYAESAHRWMLEVTRLFTSSTQPVDVKLKARKQEYYTTKLQNRFRLNKEGSSKELYQLELEMVAPFNYKPGDTLGVAFRNNARVVAQVLEEINAELTVETALSASQKLEHELEISRLTPSFFKDYNTFAKNAFLQKCIDENDFTAFFNDGYPLINLLKKCKCDIGLNELIGILKPIHPRYYSVASSKLRKQQGVDILVKSDEFGSATPFLCSDLEIGETVLVKQVSNKHFHMPGNTNTPIVMIANGVGVAPFRAFMQEVEESNEDRLLWLFWGERNKAYDTYYQEEFENYLDSQVLNKFSRVFSRDEDELYVQDILLKEKESVVEWLQKGAQVYVCGSISMGEAVRAVFSDLIQKAKVEGNLEDYIVNKLYHEELF